MAYQAKYTPLFEKDLRRYRGMRIQILRRVTRLRQNPYQGTERLGKQPGGLDLRGCRSARLTRNFRLIFVVCEECRQVPECRFCFCEGLPDETVVFLTVGPHQRAYTMREERPQYVAEAAS